MNFRGKAGSASALADSWHLTHADILCCAVPIVVFLSIICCGLAGYTVLFEKLVVSNRPFRHSTADF
jgi:hypothetical protein